MVFTNLDQIVNCIKDWIEIRDTPQAKDYLETGNSFSHECTETNNVLNAYPGICINKNVKEMYFFLIPQDQDIEQKPEILFEKISYYKVVPNLGDPHEIPDEEALRRINNWNNGYPEWLDKEIEYKSSTGGVFKVFSMPSSYMKENGFYTTSLALKSSPASEVDYTADLVTSYNDSDSSKSYYDTARPVPPFSASEDSFYLLQLAES